ncbi:hypothetical protein [Hufsiella ginkgonis]|uniref:Uncharacterized protein n=1 Tax=Hufsiella ginkgonis TaxID=2695274 RepID=A0A7K1Y409_9SPHI|nr:hypothetical protein [Hufsiella ginkgonis]MXV18000.1 hypothetical protein [Hufsiella ginkgonis]
MPAFAACVLRHAVAFREGFNLLLLLALPFFVLHTLDMPDMYKPIHPHPGAKYREEQLIRDIQGYSQDPDQKRIPHCAEILQKARMARQWIYDPKTHEWYSPDEFDKAFGKIMVGNETMLARVVIKHPNEGIEAGYKVVAKMQEKLNSLVQRVVKWGTADNHIEPTNRA